jgi:hypothetical protein
MEDAATVSGDTTITDAKGRKLLVHIMDPGDMLDLAEAAEDQSSNRGFMAMAMHVCSVTEIDGVPVPFPANKRDIKALAKKLGNEGLLSLYAFGSAEAPAPDVLEQAKN